MITTEQESICRNLAKKAFSRAVKALRDKETSDNCGCSTACACAKQSAQFLSRCHEDKLLEAALLSGAKAIKAWRELKAWIPTLPTVDSDGDTYGDALDEIEEKIGELER
jgi:hypothetical protein